MNNPKTVKVTTDRLATRPAAAKVVVLTQMDSLTQISTATIRRDMAKSVKKDVKVLEKFGLFTTD